MNIPTPSPIEPTADQAATIRRLTAFGARPDVNATVDAGPLDTPATFPCGNDWAHGWGTVCLPNHADPVCPGCGETWLRWHPGEHVAVDVLIDPYPRAGELLREQAGRRVA